jgi:DDE superfamily endonuclease
LKPGFPALLVRVDKDSTLGGDVADFFYQVLMETDVLEAGDTVVMDNCRTHGGGMSLLLRAMLREFGVALVYLPKYSPECNPIELAFGKFKQILKHRLPVRKCQADSRIAIDMAFSMITADDMKAFYRHCGHIL